MSKEILLQDTVIECHLVPSQQVTKMEASVPLVSIHIFLHGYKEKNLLEATILPVIASLLKNAAILPEIR